MIPLASTNPVCSVCNINTHIPFPHACPYHAFIVKLYNNFRYDYPYYEISLSSGIITCYTEENIIWGRIIAGSFVTKRRTLAWVANSAKMHLYFDTRNIVHISVTELNEIVYNLHPLVMLGHTMNKHGLYLNE